MTNRTSLFAARRTALLRVALLAGVAALSWPSLARGQDPFVDAVVSYSPGPSGGFGAAALPNVVLGPPRGGGALQESFDVVSLGSGGTIVLRFDPPVICDGPGADFTVFENAFHSGSIAGPVFAEYGFVAVSQDGVHFIPFPHDPVTHAGLAGQTAVFSHPDNGIDPLDPSVSGGDQFDLATVGLSWAAYVRITDVAGAIPDPGDLPQFSVPPSAGFDLDAIAALHACDPGGAETATPTPTPTASPPPATTATTAATATTTPSATAPAPAAAHDAAVLGRRPLRLRIRAGRGEETKRLRIKVRNADAAGELPIRLSVSACAAAHVDIDFDRRTPGPQDVVVLRAGRTRAALVSVTMTSAGVTTPDRHTPHVCPLLFTASAAVPGNVDPQPGNDTVAVIVAAVDANDLE